jgi:hypothetical protein
MNFKEYIIEAEREKIKSALGGKLPETAITDVKINRKMPKWVSELKKVKTLTGDIEKPKKFLKGKAKKKKVPNE